jgi:hypothetical protein
MSCFEEEARCDGQQPGERCHPPGGEEMRRTGTQPATKKHRQAYDEDDPTEIDAQRGHEVKRAVEEVQRGIMLEKHQARTDEQHDEPIEHQEVGDSGIAITQ